MNDVEREKSDEHELDDANFLRFKEHVERWRSALGLTDWSVEYAFKTVEEEEALGGNKALVWMNRGGMCAVITLNKVWKRITPTPQSLNKCALHEVCELLLRPLLTLAEARFNVDDEDIEYEKHRVIRRLENAFVIGGE